MIIKKITLKKATGALQLHLAKKNGIIQIKGAATLIGKLILSFTENDIPGGAVTIMTCASRKGQFSNIKTEGQPSAYTVKVNHQSNIVSVTVSHK